MKDSVIVASGHTYDRNSIARWINSGHYVLDLLVETGMLACKPIDTPIEQNPRLGEDIDDTPVDGERY
jgi:hypothetical protein